MLDWFFVYLIGVVVGIAMDNLFWIGVAKYREIAHEQEEKGFE